MLIRKSWQKQTNKTKGKAMRNNPDDLSNQVIAKIKKWLRSEVKENNKYTYDDYNDFDDLDVYLFRGRSECASGLLKQINKWEKE
tara:strand:- start:141 stop:395 length:255 start_codon:yes stop_codon:yes gene_type:complete